jgi:antitoxin CptB
MNDERKRILYQSWHRGCKETDVVLGPFAEAFLPECSEADLALFIALLNEDDWDIWHWITHHPEATPGPHQSIFSRIFETLQLGKGNIADVKR